MSLRSGLVVGSDFFVAYSSEREDPGNTLHRCVCNCAHLPLFLLCHQPPRRHAVFAHTRARDLLSRALFHACVSHMTHPILSMRSIPKVVGGYDEHSLALADALYSAGFTSIHKVSSCRVAEASKIVENVRARAAIHVPPPLPHIAPLPRGSQVYRCVNIALVNELKMTFDKMDIDIWEVLDAAATKPFGFHRFNPGPGKAAADCAWLSRDVIFQAGAATASPSTLSI